MTEHNRTNPNMDGQGVGEQISEHKRGIPPLGGTPICSPVRPLGDHSGLTPFICAMLKADTAALAKADPTKLAAKYRIPAATAQFYIQHERNAR